MLRERCAALRCRNTTCRKKGRIKQRSGSRGSISDASACFVYISGNFKIISRHVAPRRTPPHGSVNLNPAISCLLQLLDTVLPLTRMTLAFAISAPFLASARAQALAPAQCCAAAPAPFRPPRTNPAQPPVRLKGGTSPGANTNTKLAGGMQENAVLEGLARRREVDSVLEQLRAMQGTGVSVDTHSLCAVTDMVVSACESDDIVRTVRLLHTAAPPGYGTLSYANLKTGARVPLPGRLRLARYVMAAMVLGTLGVTVTAELLVPITHHSESHAVLALLGVAAAYDRYAYGAAGYRMLATSAAHLLADAPDRAARADAASFVAGYLLGLPWYSLRGQPSGKELGAAHPDNVLVWLLAGSAAEAAIDEGAVVESAPNAALRYARSIGRAPARARADTEVAYGRACEFVAKHAKLIDDVAAAMSEGSTAGECLAIVIDGIGGVQKR